MTMPGVEDFFEGKPVTYEIYVAVADRILALGPSEIEIKSQISFGVNRKYAWFWLYNVTRKNPNGILHLMLAIDHEIEDPHVRDVSQIGKSRWNHQIVVRTLDEARSDWLGHLLEAAHQYGSG